MTRTSSSEDFRRRVLLLLQRAFGIEERRDHWKSLFARGRKTSGAMKIIFSIILIMKNKDTEVFPVLQYSIESRTWDSNLKNKRNVIFFVYVQKPLDPGVQWVAVCNFQWCVGWIFDFFVGLHNPCWEGRTTVYLQGSIIYSTKLRSHTDP